MEYKLKHLANELLKEYGNGCDCDGKETINNLSGGDIFFRNEYCGRVEYSIPLTTCEDVIHF